MIFHHLKKSLNPLLIRRRKIPYTVNQDHNTGERATETPTRHEIVARLKQVCQLLGMETPAPVSNNLTLRTRIKHLARKAICFSRSIELHEKVIRAFIENICSTNLRHYREMLCLNKGNRSDPCATQRSG